MFVGIRDVVFAKGRFALLASVVALMTILVGFLSGLTVGLAAQNVSGLFAVGANQFVFSTPASGSAAFATSALTSDEVSEWMSAAGTNASAVALGISQVRASVDDDSTAVTVFGQDAALPGASGGAAAIPATAGSAVLSTGAAKALGAGVGDTITIAGSAFTVSGLTGDSWYSHTPVIQLRLADWQKVQTAIGGNATTAATVVAVAGTPAAAATSVHGTTAESFLPSLMATPSLRSEIGSLLMIVGMLFGISALVVGAFFTVWTMQRQADIAVLKALGAPTTALVRDALGQAGVVLALGVGVGLAVVTGLGALAANALPFVLSPLTTLAPAALMVLLGLLGAGFALRTVTSTDPLTALGANR